MARLNQKNNFLCQLVLFTIAIFIMKNPLILAQNEAKSNPQPAQSLDAKNSGKSLRDPMAPTDMSIFEVTSKKMITKRSPFKVQGIGRGSEEGAFAIIGGKVYREGETKGEITVVKITGTKVDILVNGSPETLAVKEK